MWRPQFTAQTWLLRPGPSDELEKADRMVNALESDVATLKCIVDDVYVWPKRGGRT